MIFPPGNGCRTVRSAAPTPSASPNCLTRPPAREARPWAPPNHSVPPASWVMARTFEGVWLVENCGRNTPFSCRNTLPSREATHNRESRSSNNAAAGRDAEKSRCRLAPGVQRVSPPLRLESHQTPARSSISEENDRSPAVPAISGTSTRANRTLAKPLTGEATHTLPSRSSNISLIPNDRPRWGNSTASGGRSFSTMLSPPDAPANQTRPARSRNTGLTPGSTIRPFPDCRSKSSSNKRAIPSA